MHAIDTEHSFQVENPSREERIQQRIDQILDDAVKQAVWNLEQVVLREGATEEEVTQALRMSDDFRDAWLDLIEEAD